MEPQGPTRHGIYLRATASEFAADLMRSAELIDELTLALRRCTLFIADNYGNEPATLIQARAVLDKVPPP